MSSRTRLRLGAALALAVGIAGAPPWLIPGGDVSHAATVVPQTVVASTTAVVSTTAVGSSRRPACPTPASLGNRAALRQLLWIGFSNEADSRLALLAANGIGGFYVTGARKSAAEVARAKAQLVVITSTERGGMPAPFVGVDEEGGRVQRFRSLGELPSARSYSTDPKGQAKVRAQAKRLRSFGVNVVFAPVLDLDARSSGVIADRSFSDKPADAWRSASEVAAAWRDAGIEPTFKHFPGHGSANGDSHALLPTTDPWATLQTRDVLPFAQAVSVGSAKLVMMGHLIVPGLTSATVPTTWTPAAYAALRGLGFGGVIVTDDLGMGALKAEPSLARRASRALTAGADMVLVSSTNETEKLLDGLELELKSGALSRATIDRALDRVFLVKCG